MAIAQSVYGHSVMADGFVEFVGPSLTLPALMEELRLAVHGRFPGEAWDGVLYAFAPDRLFAR